MALDREQRPPADLPQAQLAIFDEQLQAMGLAVALQVAPIFEGSEVLVDGGRCPAQVIAEFANAGHSVVFERPLPDYAKKLQLPRCHLQWRGGFGGGRYKRARHQVTT